MMRVINIPLVSIYMLTYNHENYISQAIEGIMMQKTNFFFQLVIGEDCSQDKTREITLQYKRKYPDNIILILQQKNVGRWQNHIDTMNSCTGKYIAMCEGDDYWTDPLKLQKQVDILEKNSNIGLVHSDYDYYNSRDNILIKNYYKSNKIIIPVGRVFEKVFKDTIVRTLTICYRREINDYANPFTSYAIQNDIKVGDSIIFLTAARFFEIHYMEESTGVYRRLTESASSSDSPKKRMEFLKEFVFNKLFYIKYFNLNNEFSNVSESYIEPAKSILFLAFYLNKKEDFSFFYKLISNTNELTLKEKILNLCLKSIFLQKIVKFLSKVYSKILRMLR